MTTHRESFAAEAVVPTARAGRYLAQLCEHLEAIDTARRRSGHQRREHAPNVNGDEIPVFIVTDIRRSATFGTIRFDSGTCRLRVDGHTLRMSVTADDPDTLERMKTSFAHRLEQIGRRDNLAVTWTTRLG